MFQTQHLYQSQYGGHDQSPWQHSGSQQNHSGLNSAQNQAQVQAAAAAAAAAAAQQQHYSRIAVNHNHNSNHHQTNSNNRQSSGDNAQQNNNNNASLTTMNDQGSPGMESGLSEENRKVLQWVAELMEPSRREGALMELSKKREQVPELALVLWHSFGVMTSLLQEIISVYPLLNPSQLTAAASNRVCNALALLQCVASHNETRGLFLNGRWQSSRV